MAVKLNLGDWNGIFAVPNSVVDKHIKIAGGAQLKVLLFILRHSGRELSLDDIIDATNVNKEDVKDCIGFWVAAGLLKNCDNTLVPGESTEPMEIFSQALPEREEEKPKPRPVTRVQRPDPVFVANRIAEDPEIAFLMQEAEIILARPLSSGDSGTLIMLHDSDGLPSSVILMIMQYAAGLGKGMKYVEALGAAWAAEGISTLEQAENKLKTLDEAKQAWGIIQSTFGLDAHSPTEKEKSNATRWVHEMGFSKEMLRMAYEICIDAKGKYLPNYVNRVLESWHLKGIKTVDQVRADIENDKKNKASGTKGMGGQPSYDLSEFENTSMFDD